MKNMLFLMSRLNILKYLLAYFVTIFFLAMPTICPALQPENLLVIANKKARSSVGLAKHYMKKRGVPEDNLLKIWVDDDERCSRKEYQQKIAAPVRRFLQENMFSKQIHCLLLMYGLPLKVAGPPETESEKKTMQDLLSRKDKLARKLEASGEKSKAEVKKAWQEVKKKIGQEKNKRNRSSSVDSELALVLADEYTLSMWRPNPYFIGFRDKELPLSRLEVLMVARLDGPDSHTVKRLIHDSLQAEKTGLKGTAYFDARWPAPDQKKKSGTGFYDQSIHKAAKRLEKNSKLQIEIEDSDKLFQPGQCPEAALYCGWYNLAHYVDAFDWQPGAVGYHIASQECQSLKRGDYWCKRMLEDGVAATLGPIGEPYLQSFPVPEIFFAYLLDGRYTLAEAYLLSNPFWSWKMVLVGDPLYRPFEN